MTLNDTADTYGPYTKEQLVGRALQGRRADAVLATKCGLEVRSIEPLELAAQLVPTDAQPAHLGG